MTEHADEGKSVSDELRDIREQVRRRALLGDADAPDAAVPRVRQPSAPAEAEHEVSPAAAPAAPDTGPVNEKWRAEPEAPRGGLAGLLFRFLNRYLRPRFEAQRDFNSVQVQLDNALLRYIDERLDATHAHYDAVLGTHGRRFAEVDERHLILQEELVVHVEDLVKRIDLVHSETSRGRLSLEFAIEDVRARLERLEESLQQR